MAGQSFTLTVVVFVVNRFVCDCFLDLEGEPKALGSVTMSESEGELNKLAGEIGPMKEGEGV